MAFKEKSNTTPPIPTVSTLPPTGLTSPSIRQVDDKVNNVYKAPANLTMMHVDANDDPLTKITTTVLSEQAGNTASVTQPSDNKQKASNTSCIQVAINTQLPFLQEDSHIENSLILVPTMFSPINSWRTGSNMHPGTLAV